MVENIFVSEFNDVVVIIAEDQYLYIEYIVVLNKLLRF